MPKLFAVYLGGRLGLGRLGEDHEVVLAVASDSETARIEAKKKWKGCDSSAHVDALEEIHSVDGYDIYLRKAEKTTEDMGNGSRQIDQQYTP
jgi:hypothetical protein